MSVQDGVPWGRVRDFSAAREQRISIGKCLLLCRFFGRLHDDTSHVRQREASDPSLPLPGRIAPRWVSLKGIETGHPSLPLPGP